MRVLSKIVSSRWNAMNYPSWQIVWEWEQILSNNLNIPTYEISGIWNRFYKIIERWSMQPLYHCLLPKMQLKLHFVMTASTSHYCINNKNTIPVIIDFWLEDKDVNNFFLAYKNSPLILVTNKEVYDLLVSHNPTMPVEHWPLSFPDCYALQESSKFKKDYEFVIFGRPNPFFIRLLDTYCERHSDFRYILNKGDISNRQYETNDGIFISDSNTRESYLNLIRKTKISCYTTPGFDEAKKESNRFNQVTPRVMELLCNGCQVIGHYPMSADVEWYELNKVVPNVDNYEEFECELNKMRIESFDQQKVLEFMSKHYTSTRAKMLIDILRKHNIVVG